jgi:hypothetical protein
MRRSIIPNTIPLVALSIALSFGALPQPAQAQYFNNMPYYLGTSVLWPLSRVLFGSSNTYNYMNPYYLGNTLVNRTVTGTGILRAPGYGPMPMGLAEYTDEEPLNSPRQRNRPFRYGQYGVDQTAYASGFRNPDPDAVVPQAVGQPGAPGMPAIIPGQAQGVPAPLPVQQVGQTAGMPPLAPQRHKHKQSRAEKLQQQQQLAPLSAVPAAVSPAPLAQGFVDLVNSKYDGDISKALFNADSRAWAHTVGLVDNNDIFGADLSQERVNVISRIFKDPGLDACSKLEATKILLRTSSAATPVAGVSH